MIVRLRRWLGLGVLAIAVVVGAVMLRLDGRVRAYLAGPALGSARVYGAPSVLHSGDRFPPGWIERKLTRLGYRRAAGGEIAPGEFRKDPAGLALWPRPAAGAGGPAGEVYIDLRRGEVGDIRERDGGTLAELALEPELVAVVGGQRPALETATEEVPPACRGAVLAAEDRRFFFHPGIDPGAIARALFTDLRAGARRQGGSTITQQLAKNAFLSPRRTIGRKLREAALALLLELHATKEEILRRYLASVYLGTENSVPVHGLAQAAEVYFGKPVGELRPGECALLAGMIRSPNGLAPRRHAREAIARRNDVLALMAEDHQIEPAAASAAAAEPLRLAEPGTRTVASLYVADEVAHDLRRLLPPDLARAPGLTVQTDIDPDAQRAAERAVRRRLETVERGRRRARGHLEAALVALDPTTGHVRALVGGRDYGASPLDRAIRARRQPGSAFKPFVYLAALDPARRGAAPLRTVVSLIDDAPVTVPVGSTVWRPVNYDGGFHGALPLEDALADSVNTATVRLALDVGIDAVAQAAVDAGVGSPLPHVPALALGVADVSLLELTAAYGVIARGGVRRPPVLVTAITSADGDTLYRAPDEEQPAIDPAVAYLVTHALERVIDVGTARAARGMGLSGPAAGKTGTTDETRDAWFIGFTPDVVAGVWVGYDDNRPTGLTGAAGALPIWTDFVRATSHAGEAAGFPVPDDIVWRVVDPSTGLIATADCPERRREPFLAGTEPRQTCNRHGALFTTVGGGIGGVVRDGARALGAGGERVRDWFERLFR